MRGTQCERFLSTLCAIRLVIFFSLCSCRGAAHLFLPLGFLFFCSVEEDHSHGGSLLTGLKEIVQGLHMRRFADVVHQAIHIGGMAVVSYHKFIQG